MMDIVPAPDPQPERVNGCDRQLDHEQRHDWLYRIDTDWADRGKADGKKPDSEQAERGLPVYLAPYLLVRGEDGQRDAVEPGGP